MNESVHLMSEKPENQLLTNPFSIHQQVRYSTERSFSATKFEETVWDRLLDNNAESYRYHLAFEISKVEGFKTGYVAVKRGGVVVCIAPYFVTDYRLDTTVQGGLKYFLNKISRYFPNLLSLRLVCVGSPVTDSCKIGLSKDYPFDPEILKVLCKELDEVAKLENASVIAFKDVIEGDAKSFSKTLNQIGFSDVPNMPVATNIVKFSNLDEYLDSLSYGMRKNLRRKLKSLEHVRIEEHITIPPNFEKIYKLYLQTYEQSDLKFEKLTSEFFESIVGLMPTNCRLVLYYVEDQLIAFNFLIHRNGVLFDKYIGMEQSLAKKYNIYFLSWLHNIEMCIRDDFHTYQSGQASYETKIRLGAELDQTYVFFKHCNPIFNKPLKLISHFLAYANFDKSLEKQTTKHQ